MKGFLTASLFVACATVSGADLDTIGASLLRKIDPSLTGLGVPVVQAEAVLTSHDFEVNPAAVGQAQSLFSWISTNGTASVFPNSAGSESGHADSVGANFYGVSGGVAPGVSHVDNYEAQFFYDNVVGPAIPTNLITRIVNQSFIFDSEIPSVDQDYDNFAASFNTLFVSSAGNGGPVASPATCYNGLGVGVYGASSTVGPTSDGRCKPDIVSPGGTTSTATPYVSGAAAILLQAANRGDGGNVPGAADARTLKALLINGAVKPNDWTNSPAHPLDLRYGGGILNVFNSWKQLTAGKAAFVEATSSVSGTSHPPGTSTNNVPTSGWDFASITNLTSGSIFKDRVHHYYFNVPVTNGESFTLTATLVWNRALKQTTARDLNIYLYDTATGSLIASSISTVDNVEHLYQTKLPAGRYDLQVFKSGSGITSGSSRETYALAFEAFNVRLNLARTNNVLFVSWPISPNGFILQSTTNLSAPSWTAFPALVAVTNGQNVVGVSLTNTQRFFRLQRP